MLGLLDYLGDWLKSQQDISEKKGLWSGGQVWEGGHPTGLGVADILKHYAQGLGTGDVPAKPNYAFLEALDMINRGEGARGSVIPGYEREFIQQFPADLMQRAGGPTEEFARKLFEVRGPQTLWDVLNYKRGIMNEMGKVISDPNTKISQAVYEISKREYQAAADIAKRFGVNPDAPRPRSSGVPMNLQEYELSGSPKLTGETPLGRRWRRMANVPRRSKGSKQEPPEE